jgi:enoyl-CoA hydratase
MLGDEGHGGARPWIAGGTNCWEADVSDPTASSGLLVERDGPVATLRIDRPAKRNALDAGLLDALQAALLQIAKDRDVRAVILTGGESVFAAGVDIGSFAAAPGVANAYRAAEARARCWEALIHLPQPTIAAVAGYALGGGCELALACDLRLAAESARFGQPEVRLGLIPGAGGTQRLPRLIGATRAKELIFFGDAIDAQEAYRLGLVNRVVPVDRLLAEAREWALRLAALPPLALAMAKQAIDTGADLALPAALYLEQQSFVALFGTADEAEGVAAFLEKRDPRFTGD